MKVHVEVRRYAKEGYTIFLVGHRKHVEVMGTSGEAQKNVIVVESVKEAEKVEAPDLAKVAYTTQTTLSLDDTREIIEVLKRRFPKIVGPRKPDICYATQNRQDAVKKLANFSDLILIVGSDISSNSNRMREVAQGCGVEAYLVEHAHVLQKEMFHEGMVVGVSSGASTPEVLVQEVIEKLKEFGAKEVEELEGVEENIEFPLPAFARKELEE
jgi:4-hydroxy-3-methylbut-2-enyl diphosphate reductase